MRSFIMAMVLSVSFGCASKHKVSDLSSEMKISEVKGRSGFQTVGLNEKKDVVLQEETKASTELSIQENVNLHFRTEVEHEAWWLNKCRRDMALMGGDLPADTIVDMKDPETVREEMGLDDQGELKIVKQQFFAEKLKKEREYNVALRKMLTVVKRQRAECEFKAEQRQVAGR